MDFGLKNARGSSLAWISLPRGVAVFMVYSMWLVETVSLKQYRSYRGVQNRRKQENLDRPQPEQMATGNPALAERPNCHVEVESGWISGLKLLVGPRWREFHCVAASQFSWCIQCGL